MKQATLFAALGVVTVATGAPLPKVWMSAQWRDPFAETVRVCAEQGVDMVSHVIPPHGMTSAT